MWEMLLTGPAAWFTVPALIGTVFFVLRMALLLVGSSHALHVGDAHAGDGSHSDSGHDFKLLSLQSVAAFLMGFGWGGVGALKGAGRPISAALVVGLLCGAGMVWLLGLLLRGIAGLHQSGTLDLGRAVGLPAEVYVSTSGAAGGQVRFTIDGRQRICNARTLGEELASGTRVTIVGIDADHTLTIARL
jgi:hypothetical protein